MTAPRTAGLIAAPFTPFAADGGLDLAQVGPYAQLLARNGVAGAFVCGSNGEGNSMALGERLALAEAWIAAAPAGFRIIVHAGTNALPDARAIVRHAQAAGAAAVALSPPTYHRPADVAALAGYIAELAAEVPGLPVYYYHIPVMTGVRVAMIDLLEALDGRVANFAGIKYTDENLMDFSLCLRFRAGRYDMLYGRDELLVCALLLGAAGAVGSTFNFAAPLYRQVIERFQAGDLAGATAAQDESHRMIRALFSQGVAAIPAQRAVMQRLGIACGDARMPLPRLGEAERARIAAALDACGFDAWRCR